METTKGIGCIILIAVALIGTLTVGFGGTAVVDAKEACVVKRGGSQHGFRDSGFHFKVPIADKYDCFETIAQVYETVDEGGDSESKADYVDYAIDGVSVDGQPITVTYTIRFKMDESQLLFTHANIGRTLDLVTERVVKFHSRSIVRHVVNTKTAEELYLGGLDPISAEIQDKLIPLFADSGVILEYFELKRPSFTDEYEDAIERKQLKLEEAAAKTNELKVEEQEAERKRIEAEGEAERQRIIAQGDADAEVIRSEGSAEAMANEGKVLEQYPTIVDLRSVEAIIKANLVVVPESSMPIVNLPTEREGDE